MRGRALTAVLAGASLVVGALVGGAGPATAASDSLTISGRGFGHGVGLSQYGADARAKAGQNVSTILAAYYPGTASGTVPDAQTFDVWLKGDTDAMATAVAETGLALRGTNPAKGRSNAPVTLPAKVKVGSVWVAPTQWRVLRKSSTWRLQALAKGTWVASTKAAATLAGASRVTFVPVDGTVRNVVGSMAREYRGTLSANIDAGAVTVTVTTNATSYLRSVVPAEMPSYWHAEALKAQAIAARTYAVYERASAYRPWWWDTCDTTSCQMFPGAAEYDLSGRLVRTFEATSTTNAVAATANHIRTYAGKPAFTQFSASNGGYSVAREQPYLQARADPFDTYSWTRVVPFATIRAAYPAVGSVRSVVVTARDGLGWSGGRVTGVKVTGSKGSVTDTGDGFRIKLGLLSTLYTVSS
ncbi:SpoIID/LytB domain-containing protein [Cellulomonas composti]|uniref:Sporulation stage II protein D amidase enhancer LytB N-terminal domain-containing protein n=1 Tax=Cellulomonas composti TaxID=266130 RepID=A0A511JAZ3_9CELL|nr:SpoIID/LytB domain-containing protein [Cellulomonas composti]GEL95160.1 hypothetical protein CCO02nite_18180 [Cellulomonas composti]